MPGLRREDLYDDDYADVQEAIRRLSEHEKNLRHYRVKRAFDLTLKHSILPKEQWTKPEEVFTVKFHVSFIYVLCCFRI